MEIKLAKVLTVRLGSERFPQKAIQDIDGKPLLLWVIERMKSTSGSTIVATTTNEEDYKIEELAKSASVPVYRGSASDIVGRVDEAVKKYSSDADFVFRVLGDCPFLETELVTRSVTMMRKYNSDAFLWHTSPDVWPCYGAREFPFSRSAWDKIVNEATGEEREHSDAYFHNHRDKFKIVYHAPPPSIYFRSYRLEVDYPEDLELMRKISAGVGMLASMKEVIRYLDNHPTISRINRERVEKTGPITSYDYSLRRKWMKSMIGKPIVGWDNELWYPPDDDATPIFCNSGQCFLGYGNDGVLFTKSGDRIAGDAYKSCPCGAGKYWKSPIKRSR